jgi:tetratricopeptide (TPR) repeat protein
MTEHPAFQRAVASLRAGHAKDAEDSFKLVLREQPKHLAALNLLAVLLTQLGRFAEAEAYLRRALQENANSEATLHNYAVVLKALNRPAEALEPLTQALKINPNSAGRFAMSQLQGIGAPELVAKDLAAYKDMAVALARHIRTWPLLWRAIRSDCGNCEQESKPTG